MSSVAEKVDRALKKIVGEEEEGSGGSSRSGSAIGGKMRNIASARSN